MNGEMFQMARLVRYVKNAVAASEEPPFANSRHTESIVFTFMDGTTTASDPQEWCRLMRSKALKEIRMYVNTDKNDPRKAGFANAMIEAIVTSYAPGYVTAWLPHWDFNKELSRWEVSYREVLWQNMRMELLDMEDPTEDFKSILKRIGLFADEIGFDTFGNCFRKAFLILTGDSPAEYPEWMQRDGFVLPPDSARLFLAASAADVFGGMGSWNDSPPWYAHDLGREEEYNQLSHELFVQSRNAVVYAVNY